MSRSFAVFLDNPQPAILKPKASHNVASSLLSPSSNVNANYCNPLTTSTEKENLHPVTGERPSSTTTTTGKKRKPSVSILSTKVHNPPTNKKQKESSKSLKPEAKKRKPSPSTSSSIATKSKSSSSDKESKRAVSTLGVSKKPSTSSRSSKLSSRKVSPMPKLEEESDVLGKERERINQAEIDSRCYELTVSPLADVTRAYDTSPSMGYLPSGKLLNRSVKEKSAEPELFDRYPHPLSSSTSMPSLSGSYFSPSSKRAVSTPPGPSQETQAFSTPERKQIYAAFTFTSPSPTSIRLGLTRSTSVDALDFNKLT